MSGSIMYLLPALASGGQPTNIGRPLDQRDTDPATAFDSGSPRLSGGIGTLAIAFQM